MRLPFLHVVLGGLLALSLTMALSVDASAQRRPALPAGAKYVAMGSSFAAGPGLLPYVADAPARCGRSSRNYAHLLAARRGLSLVDVTCSGATTAAVLTGWRELPPQVAAVDADTRLVTVTIGGNDLGYIGNLMSLSCIQLATRLGDPAGRCRPAADPGAGAFDALPRAMADVAAAVRARAPNALLVFVDYPVVLPPRDLCDGTPLTREQADAARALAVRLAAITEAAASAAGARLLKVSELSRGHDACAADPWMTGYPAPTGAAAYHVTAPGMEAVARALDQMLDRVPAP